MPRTWNGTIAIEGVQTGDGRLIAEGALDWAGLPMPLAWLQEEQHSMPAGGVQVGIITAITRVGNKIQAEGILDDEIPEAAEVIRRMDAGTAPFGNRWGISIDADDYAVELVLPEGLEDEDLDDVVIIAASCSGGRGVFRLGAGNPHIVPITAAAGEDDGGDQGDVLMEASADELIERATRLRIRGATLCAVPAFDGAYIELAAADAEPVAAAAPAGPTSSVWNMGQIVDDAGIPVLASGFPIAPPVDWFDDPTLTEPTPLTITDEGRVFGHLGTWDSCHDGFSDRCVRLPRNGDYTYFTRRGPVMLCREGCEIPVGHLTMDTGHHTRGSHSATEAHYDNTGTQVAYVTAGTDNIGPWVAGCVRPDLSDEEVVRLRASPPSVDMRPRDGHLELRAVLIVNVPGFPVPRALAASAAPETPAWAAALMPLARRELVTEIERANLETEIVRTS